MQGSSTYTSLCQSQAFTSWLRLGPASAFELTSAHPSGFAICSALSSL